MGQTVLNPHKSVNSCTKSDRVANFLIRMLNNSCTGSDLIRVLNKSCSGSDLIRKLNNSCTGSDLITVLNKSCTGSDRVVSVLIMTQVFMLRKILSSMTIL